MTEKARSETAEALDVQRPTSLATLALLFAKLSIVSFGGPAAHIALMEDEVLRKRRWLSREAFLDFVGATNLIPGPNSTELAMHIGRERAGWRGLVVAGTAFIAPAAMIVAACAWVYVRYGALPAVVALFAGVQPVVIAVVVQALWRLGQTALRGVWLWIVAAASFVAAVRGVHELAVIAIAALVGLIVGSRRQGGRVPVPNDTDTPANSFLGGLAFFLSGTSSTNAIVAGGVGALATATLPSATALFLVFARIGAVLFGSGYVLLAFLRRDLVERLGWLSERQLLDAVAIGQITPGPLFTTATFAGWIIGGAGGATAATLGIFLPAFVFVALSAPLLPRLRRSPVASAMLDAVNAASLALMAHVTWQLGHAALVDPLSVGIAAVSALLLFSNRVSSVWLVAGGGALSVILLYLRGG